MMESGIDNGQEKDPIAWIEMKPYGDVDEVKQDLRELSDRAGFEITDFETVDPPNSRNGNKIVKAYTDTFREVPKDKLTAVREWLLREVYWAQHVCNAKVNIDKRNF
ncbi:hypothetical protein AKJ40_04210 [candidate division MSBL1 archaeon SCGC-AAA259M10]|uniref:Uncharacterized protein n=2 Tax=candidate division MSBL1 TaxID=215777 RepID=A0A133U7K6_9EURY|nr:hypothetical protein AKJ62_01530 [candidate division MSBL1 archaeon SCGC-AAA259D14]KXA98994.1 hypothetical protein AKJ40_04210 [candidate division MSBL1 archaeon SCGC-AAA259M10]